MMGQQLPETAAVGGDEELEAAVRGQTIGRAKSTANTAIKGLFTVPPITAVDDSEVRE